MIPVGAAIGSFTGGQICKLGRRNAIFIINAIIVLGSGLTMIFSFWPLILGRLLLGFASGSFTVVCPLFVSETSPSEVAGPLGGVNQFACCFGIMVADILGFAVPYSYVEGGTNTNPEVYTTQSWRGVFILPAGLAVVQSLLLLVMFRNDTPKYYKQKGNDEAVKRVETLIFKTAQVDPTPEIQNEDNAENQQNDQESPADGNVIHDNPKEVEAKITVRSLFTVKSHNLYKTEHSLNKLITTIS